jgi:hypothetical protein
MSERAIGEASSNGSHRLPEEHATGDRERERPPVVLTPRRGGEASWPDPPGAAPKLANFSSSPVSAPPPARERHPRIDIVTAAVIVLVVAVSAALYISGTFTHTHHNRPPSSSDPFAVG